MILKSKNIQAKAIKLCWVVLVIGKEHVTTLAAVGAPRMETIW